MAATSALVCPSGTTNWCLAQAISSHGSTSSVGSGQNPHLSFPNQVNNIWTHRKRFGGGVRKNPPTLTSKQCLSHRIVRSALVGEEKQELRRRKAPDVFQSCKGTALETEKGTVWKKEVAVVGVDDDTSSEGVDGPPLQVVALGFALGVFLLASNSQAVAAEGLPIHHIAGLLDDGFDLDIGEWLQETLFYLGQEANGVVKSQLAAGNTFASVGVIFGAGLVTSFSPCTLSVLPLTIGYIGGYDTSKSRASVAFDSIAFALGLATTLAGLGVVASLAGKAYGQIGQGLPIAVSCVAILMGLNLLQVVPLQLPSFFGSFDPKQSAAGLPSGAQAYLAGLTFALAASPCSTPVLATLLSFVASTQDPVAGGGLLLVYTMGYVAPLLLAATFTGALKRLLSFRRYSSWINPASGALLLGGGVYSLLTRVFPETSMMNMVM